MQLWVEATDGVIEDAQDDYHTWSSSKRRIDALSPFHFDAHWKLRLFYDANKGYTKQTIQNKIFGTCFGSHDIIAAIFVENRV